MRISGIRTEWKLTSPKRCGKIEDCQGMSVEKEGGEDRMSDNVQENMEERMKKRQKRKQKRYWFDVITTAIIVVAVGVFLFSGYKLIRTWQDYKKGTSQYEDLAARFPTMAPIATKENIGNQKETASGQTEGAGETDAPGETAPEVIPEETAPPIDWLAFYDEMKSLNPDYVGWIILEGTQINYPIVQAADNDYYLHRLFDGTENFSGTLFADYRSTDLFKSGNTIIHGHNMKNGSMFAGLLKYREEWFYNSHKRFSVYTEEGEIVYEVFAIYATDPVSTSYVTEFSSDEEYVNWLNMMYEQSVVKPPVELNADTQVLTLSTCVNDSRNRLIIQAKRITP